MLGSIDFKFIKLYNFFVLFNASFLKGELEHALNKQVYVADVVLIPLFFIYRSFKSEN